MPAPDPVAPTARRESEVYRNLDDPLKVLGLLTLRSCAFLFIVYAVLLGVDLLFGLWTALFGGYGFLIEPAMFGALAAGLAYAEKHEDEHFVSGMLRYYLSRRGRVLYGGVIPDGRGAPALDGCQPSYVRGRITSNRGEV